MCSSDLPAAIARYHVVQVKVLPVELLPAILAGVFVPLENVVPREFDFFFRQTIEHNQEDDARDANPEGDGMDAFGVGFLFGKVAPFAETISLERTIARIQDGLGVPFKEQSEGAPRRADVDRLPETVQHQNLTI